MQIFYWKEEEDVTLPLALTVEKKKKPRKLEVQICVKESHCCQCHRQKSLIELSLSF